jgi:DNA-directed RNA polymerase specialized sigma24 family protein
MSKLKERDRRLISLRVGGELSYREIGNLVGLSEQAATHATYRALERFRRLVEEPK